MRLNKDLVILALVLLLIKQSTLFRKALAYYRWSKLKVIEAVPCPPEFLRAKNAFLRNYLEGRERGSQMTLTVDGKVVFDIRAGRDESCLFDDGVVMVFSSTKVIESLVVAMLVDQGKLAYEDPIAKHWPEFGERFSSAVTVAQLMGHQAGLEQIHETITTPQAQEIFASPQKQEEFVFRSLRIDERIKRGESHTRYHAVTRGIIVDLLCYKVDGRRGADFIQQEIVAKLDGPVDFSLGCPLQKQTNFVECEAANTLLESALEIVMHQTGIVKYLYYPDALPTDEELETHYRDFFLPEEVKMTLSLINRNGPTYKSLILVNDHRPGTHYLANSPEFRSLPLMSVTGISNSRSLAKIIAELACGGGKLLSPEGMAKALAHDQPVTCELFHRKLTFTNAGWSCDRLGEEWVGWGGSGGSVTVFSPRFNASFSYIPTRLEGRAYKPNGLRILKEITKVLSNSPKAYL